MVEGGGSPDQTAARCWAYRDAEGFGRLIELLIDTSVGYLCDQVAAGADVLQIFDSWAGGLSDDAFARWVVAPTRRMVEAVRARYPRVPVIGFPRGAGSRIGAYVAATGVSGIGCDTGVPLADMAALAGGAVVQGNLDPALLVVGGGPCSAAVERLLGAMRDKPFICNLGHGVRPETPPEHVAHLVAHVRAQA
jgi:uroporphyrinogen decarboxylase